MTDQDAVGRPSPAGHTDRDIASIPPAGTCEVSTRGRRSGRMRRIEIWYVVIDGQVVLTGTPGRRDWLANLRRHPEAVLHLRRPSVDLDVIGKEVTDEEDRRHTVAEAWRLQPWYAKQRYTVDDWVSGSPIVTLAPTVQHAGA